MLSYQLRPRGCKWENAVVPDFPSQGVVRLRLVPQSPFGGVMGASRTIQVGSSGKMTWDAKTGRTSAEADTELEEVDVLITYEKGDQEVRFHANQLMYATTFETRKELEAALEFLTYIMPAVLNVDFIDSPMVESTAGEVGGEPFLWQLLRGDQKVDAVTTEIQEERLARAWDRALLFSGDANRRLLAALHYFQTACRLERSGHTPWEFTAEVILNYTKVLESLFPPGGGTESMDASRDGLAALGYNTDEIETMFIPAWVLRSKLDVAHVSLAIFKVVQLQIVHSYCEKAEDFFRDLLGRVLDGTADGSHEVAPYEDSSPDAETVASIERIGRSLSA